ncbi:DUF4256 domain-containing protein [Cyclobacterium plantarum]|uniref:DUF4256 domain-containing protein n=1 Tax=Cyclobacterium plantarum TaxID=2716263 RepID=A0ABX0H7H3_9BACT|nr:DUF4256 domain-containing protein [Cyclobacterium plantarum]NHE56299.1 DUF4256 domain-containing protein [Cyclobacterium plantarum]
MKISQEQTEPLLSTLKNRFEKNRQRHQGLEWKPVEEKLLAHPEKLRSLLLMEETGGEPDVLNITDEGGQFIFIDCSPESPKGRRSLCYDPEALESRKTYKPKNSALGMAAEMGISLLSEEQYQALQQFGKFDTKTSSWIKTPADIRKLGGAIFGDWRFGRVFIYHNGAESYYGARGFRGMLKV